MTNKIVIEEVISISDIAVDDLFRLSFELNPDLKQENFQQWASKVLEFPSSCLLIAREDGGSNIIGMLTMVSYPVLVGFDKTWIEDVVVDQNFRGKGIGKLLISAAIEEARKRKIGAINLTSRPSREAANGLYQKMGFELVETNYYRYLFK